MNELVNLNDINLIGNAELYKAMVAQVIRTYKDGAQQEMVINTKLAKMVAKGVLSKADRTIVHKYFLQETK